MIIIISVCRRTNDDRLRHNDKSNNGMHSVWDQNFREAIEQTH